MNVADATSATGPANTGSTTQANDNSNSSTGSGSLDGSSFISLLTAQLKAQDPTNPMDPNQFVTELVQFNMLQQLIDIDQLLTPAASAGTNSTGSTSTSGSLPAQAARF